MYRNCDGNFVELLGQYIREWKKNQEGNANLSTLAKQAGMSDKYLHKVKAGEKHPKRGAVSNISRALGLGKEETNQLLLAAGYKSPKLKSPYEFKMEALTNRFKGKCEGAIQDYETKTDSIDTQFPELSEKLREQAKEEYGNKIKEVKGKIDKFDSLLRDFQQSMSMTDDELRLYNSNERIDFSVFPEDLREGIMRRERTAYEEAIIKTEYPKLYAILTTLAEKVPKKRIAQEVIDKILEAHKLEMSSTKAGEYARVSPNTVLKYWKETGLEPHFERGGKRRIRKEVPELTFGELLKQYRGEVNISQFAKEIGISSGYLSNLERGARKPSESKVVGIAGTLRLNKEQTGQLFQAAESIVIPKAKLKKS